MADDNQLSPEAQQYFAPELQQLAKEQQEATYGTPMQMAATAAEGAAQGVAGPLAPLAETSLGLASPEEIRKRAETNPITHGLSQVGGLGLSTMASAGIAPVLEGAGKLGAELLGPTVAEVAPTLLSKVGSAATKMAIEGGLFSAGDELTKLVTEDPEQSVSTAAINIGLGGLIGGGVGAGFSTISPLWKAAAGTKVGQLLTGLAGKGGGIEGGATGPVADAIATLGIDASPEVRAALSNDPMIQQMAKTLEQSDTSSSGLAYQKTLKEFKANLSNRVQEVLAPFSNRLPELSNAEAGKKLGTTLADEISARVSPLSEDFNRIKENFADVQLDPFKQSEMAEGISNLANEQGWLVSPSSDVAKLINTTLEELPNVKSLKNLSDYITQVGDATSKDPLNGPLRRAGGMLKDVLRQSETNAIEMEFSKTAPELLPQFRQAQKAYAAESNLKDALDSRLHLRGSTSGYAARVAEMAATDSETLLRRLSGKGDADLLSFLSTNFPKTAEQLQKYHVDTILDKAANTAKPGEAINVANLLKSVNNMEPELRSFALPKSITDKLDNVGTILDKFNEVPHNFSNTARTIDKLMGHLPGSAIGLATMAMSHNPALALTLGALTKTLGKDAPDALRLSLLKFLGSKQAVNPEAFKTMFDFASHVAAGENSLNKAAAAVMREGAEVIPIKLASTDKDRTALDKMLKVAEQAPESMINAGGQLAHYMPEHGTALGALGASAVNYLSSIRPVEERSSPLDGPGAISPTRKAAYNRALDIAQQPLVILKAVKDGSLTSEDVRTMVSVYPQLYRRFTDKLMSSMTDAISKGNTIPYATKLGLSMFAHTPLDSTMKPNAIVAAQPAPQTPPQDAQPKPQPQAAKLSKIGELNRTPDQAAATRKTGAST